MTDLERRLVLDALADKGVMRSRDLASLGVSAAYVKELADELVSNHKGDVVDVHFIGHSRGTVVVDQAALDLNGTTDPALRGGYIKMTLLDPHPANNYTGLNPQVPGGKYYSSYGVHRVLGFRKAALTEWFQSQLQDPAYYVIPQNVNETEVYYQHTESGFFGAGGDGEEELNLWGHSPNDGFFKNYHSAPIKSYDLTNHRYADTGLIGHTEVARWYLLHVVATHGRSLGPFHQD